MQATRSSWSSLKISTFIVDRICQRESAECVGKQGAHSKWAKGTTLLQADCRAWRGCYSIQSGYTLRLLGDSPTRETSWAMVVVKLQLEVGGTSTVWQSRKLNLKNFSQGLSAKILVLENL